MATPTPTLNACRAACLEGSTMCPRRLLAARGDRTRRPCGAFASTSGARQANPDRAHQVDPHPRRLHDPRYFYRFTVVWPGVLPKAAEYSPQVPPNSLRPEQLRRGSCSGEASELSPGGLADSARAGPCGTQTAVRRFSLGEAVLRYRGNELLHEPDEVGGVGADNDAQAAIACGALVG